MSMHCRARSFQQCQLDRDRTIHPCVRSILCSASEDRLDVRERMLPVLRRARDGSYTMMGAFSFCSAASSIKSKGCREKRECLLS